MNELNRPLKSIFKNYGNRPKPKGKEQEPRSGFDRVQTLCSTVIAPLGFMGYG